MRMKAKIKPANHEVINKLKKEKSEAQKEIRRLKNKLWLAENKVSSIRWYFYRLCEHFKIKCQCKRGPCYSSLTCWKCQIEENLKDHETD